MIKSLNNQQVLPDCCPTSDNLYSGLAGLDNPSDGLARSLMSCCNIRVFCNQPGSVLLPTLIAFIWLVVPCCVRCYI